MLKTKYILIIITVILLLFSLINAQQQPLLIDNSIISIGDPDKGIYLNLPIDCTSTKRDTIYIVDNKNNEVIAFNIKGDPLFKFGRQGQGPGEFLSPRSIAIDNKQLYVTDSKLNRITVFSLAGEYIRTIPFNGSPFELVIYNECIYVSIISPKNLLWKVSLDNYDNRNLLLSYDHPIISDTHLSQRPTSPIITRINNELFIGLANLGEILVYDLQLESFARSLLPTNDLTRSYYEYFNELQNNNKSTGSYIPRLFTGITPWGDNYLLVQFSNRPDRPTQSLINIISIKNGNDIEPRLIAPFSGLYRLSQLPNGMYSWLAPFEARVYIYDLSYLKDQYPETTR